MHVAILKFQMEVKLSLKYSTVNFGESDFISFFFFFYDNVFTYRQNM